jgi:hypothetical protein
VRKKPQLLLDAVPIIAAFEVHAWDQLAAQYEIVVPGVIVDEAHFYHDPSDGRRYTIDLSKYESAGTITVCDVTQEDVSALLRRFDQSFATGIHAGEAEALAYLLAQDDETAIQFVTSDTAALHATALLGLAHRSTYLGDVLRKCGFQKTLDSQHEAKHHRECISKGQEMRIMGVGLARAR